jgi:L-malate glycosyltransferase
VCHVAVADLWAGAEAQLAILLRSLSKLEDLEVSAVLFNSGRLAHDLQAAGVKTHVIPETDHHALSIVNELRNYFRRHPVDILHTHKYKDNVLGVLASRGQGIPFVVRTIHGAPEPFSGIQAFKMTLYEALDRLANRRVVDRLLAVSLALQESLVSRFGIEKVTCVHNAVDVDEIGSTRDPASLRNELGLGHRDVIIGTMGRLAPVKGLEIFLRAARIIKDRDRIAKFLVAGDGPLHDQLVGITRRLDLEHEVLFLGHRCDNHDILGIMDLFVLPSLSEGIPLVLLEALALARPVVATAVGGIPEIVEHGVSGLLVEAGDANALAGACLRVIDDPVFGRQMGSAGRRRVETAFSAAVMAADVAKVYRTLVGTRESS